MKKPTKTVIVIKPATHKRIAVFAAKRGVKKQAVADASVNLGLDEMERCP